MPTNKLTSNLHIFDPFVGQWKEIYRSRTENVKERTRSPFVIEEAKTENRRPSKHDFSAIHTRMQHEDFRSKHTKKGYKRPAYLKITYQIPRASFTRPYYPIIFENKNPSQIHPRTLCPGRGFFIIN